MLPSFSLTQENFQSIPEDLTQLYYFFPFQKLALPSYDLLSIKAFSVEHFAEVALVAASNLANFLKVFQFQKGHQHMTICPSLNLGMIGKISQNLKLCNVRFSFFVASVCTLVLPLAKSEC